MKNQEKPQDYVLGIDLGSASLGWAVIGLDDTGNAASLLKTGVRIFEPAVNGDYEKGQDESNAVQRRMARQIRRQLQRRAQRQANLFRILQAHGLLPLYEGPETDASLQRHAILNALDRELTAKWSQQAGNSAIEVPLYLLRAEALDQPLLPHELGRIFYHLSQRRGYKSNRKEQLENVKDANKDAGRAKKNPDAEKAAKKEDTGAVEAGIKDLHDAMKAANSRTLGEYFASLDPHTQKVRRRWTGRKMYEDEFELLWQKQAAHKPDMLTVDLYYKIKHELFFQRPLKSQSHRIGGCELEQGERRAPWATLEAQQFRVVQKLNDLEIIPSGQLQGMPLTKEQRQTVLALLTHSEMATFTQIRKALNLGKNFKFNLERGGEKQLKGNFTNARFSAAFGDRWSSISEEEKRQVVEEWRTIDQDDSLIRRAKEFWTLDDAGADWLVKKRAPSGYCMLSRKAIRKLLPVMEEGIRFKEAEKLVYGDRLKGGEVYDRIPPVRQALKTLRNPAVERALTELRKVVNALVSHCGAKPAEIRIELARDLKKPRQERVDATKVMRDREKEREGMRKRILLEFGEGFSPSRADIEKALLYEECAGRCAYCGVNHPFSSLFGENSPWQVDHIIPFSRIPDDSFQNKILCCVKDNQEKANRTPFEAFGGSGRFDEIMDRVKNWSKPNRGKMSRIELKTLDELQGFSNRQLNDTRYASKLACELVGTLYGGRDINTGSGVRQVVFASSGMVTAALRRGWELESILRESGISNNNQGKAKPRTDHRHHAVDAITIALSRPGMIAALSRANEQDPWWPKTGRRYPKIQAPWKDFVASIRPHIEGLNVSHRPEHRLTGALHDETNYGRQRNVGGKKVVHIRKTVNGLTEKDIENIVDAKVRDAVKLKAAEFGGTLKTWTPNKTEDDWPMLVTRTGKKIPIKRVRIMKSLGVETIGKGVRQRNVAIASNHHVAIFAQLDEHGREKRWDSLIVSLFDAMERKRKKLPLIQKKYQEAGDYAFKFSLMGGDTVLLHKDCDHEKNICKPSVWRVRSILSNGPISLVRSTDARLKKDILSAKEWWSPGPDALRKLGATKVMVDSLGRMRSAGG